MWSSSKHNTARCARARLPTRLVARPGNRSLLLNDPARLAAVRRGQHHADHHAALLLVQLLDCGALLAIVHPGTQVSHRLRNALEQLLHLASVMPRCGRWRTAKSARPGPSPTGPQGSWLRTRPQASKAILVKAAGVEVKKIRGLEGKVCGFGLLLSSQLTFKRWAVRSTQAHGAMLPFYKRLRCRF